jgi:serine/threonine protein kinase/tetratricopeptide (TPR) repeat protein
MEIFSEALELTSAEERAAYLDRACGPDRSLRGRVEGLLGAHVEGDSFLESPAAAPSVTATPGDRIGPEGPGTTIGPYKLMEPIGEGGMGVVYVAEQSQPVRRRVALKVIKPGMDTRQVIARFEAERQALALMDHPNIAKVHDGGTTESGRPYFVMELVRGLPITDYCDRQQLSIRERLDLFVLVCRAVQHAHQKGIIHRDIKPSNVLITLHDGVPVPKIIDFGIAKATGQSLSEKTVYTAFAQLVGTPLYMSPEQAELSGLDIDTRSDIYSLGVLLYELLTGTTPFDSEALKKAAFDEVRRIVREEEPPRPSTRLGSLGETLTTISARRKADPRRLGASMKGELDWVVMKALEKDRRRRYETANDFAADVMRYLTDRPVEACPPSAWYRFTKYARRNRAALTTAALVALALVTGTAVSAWQAVQARRAGAEARRRADESRQVVDYLVNDIFGSVAPEKVRARKLQGRDVTVLDLLNDADAHLSERFAGQPLVEASVRMALARAYEFVWELERSAANAARAAELRARFLGPDHLEALDALEFQAEALNGRVDETKSRAAEPLARRAFVGRRRQLGTSHPDTLRSQGALAISLAYAGRAAEGVPLMTEAAMIARRDLGPSHLITLQTDLGLGVILYRTGDPERGEAVLRKNAADLEQALGPLHPLAVGVFNDLGRASVACGHLDAARTAFLEGLGRTIKVYGPDHIRISSYLGQLDSLFGRQRDFVALRDLNQGLLREMLTTPVEPGQFLRDRRVIQLASCLGRLATLPDDVPIDLDLAVRAAEEAARLSDGKTARVTLGLLYSRAGRPDLAVQAIEKAKSRPDWSDIEGDYAWLVEALIRARRGELAEARRLYEQARNSPKPTAFGRPQYEPLQSSVEALLAGGGPPAGRPGRSPRAKAPPP